MLHYVFFKRLLVFICVVIGSQLTLYICKVCPTAHKICICWYGEN